MSWPLGEARAGLLGRKRLRATRRQLLVTLAGTGAAALATTGFAPAAWAQPSRKPNILFILMDNLGYGEPGVYGGGVLRGAPTPRIDALATEERHPRP